MSFHWFVAVTMSAAVLLMPGCSSSDKSAAPPKPSTSASKSAPTQTASNAETTQAEAPSAPLDADACVEVTGASLDLSAATSKDDARKAADTLETYDPPSAAKEAIEHFAETGGLQIDDPDVDKFNAILDQWTKAVCP